MSMTPRTDAEVEKIPLKGVFGIVPLCRQLETELNEARLTLEATQELMEMKNGGIKRKNALIRQMLEALVKNCDKCPIEIKICPEMHEEKRINCLFFGLVEAARKELE